MTTRVAERLDDWDSRSFTGGLHELEDLADGEFSGVVRAGGAELYMTTGTVVGVERGTIEDFEGASGTVFDAPSPALPLLAVMQAADADVRGKYYSEDTPMAEVDRTLSDGSFTGYVELSDNVLSGDYYLVYHGGRSMAVGFVGNSARLITDDEAFETANDEVGIYKVRQVEVDPIEIPAPEGDRSSAGEEGTEAAAAAAGNSGTTAAAAEAEDEADPEPAGDASTAAEPVGAAEEAGESDEAEVGAGTDAVAESDSEPTRNQAAAGTGSGSEAAGGDAGVSTHGEASAEAGVSTTSSADSPADTTTDSSADKTDSTSDRAGQGPGDATAGGSGGSAGGSTTQHPGAGADSGAATGAGRENQPSSGGAVPGGSTADQSGRGQAGGAGRSPEGASGGSAADLETRAIPSLDPERTKTPSRSSGASGGARGDAPAARGRTSDAGIQGTNGGPGAGAAAPAEAQRTDAGRPADSASQGTESAGGRSGSGTDRGGAGAEGVAAERYEELQSDLADRETEVERLESELDRVTTEREDLKDQLETAREERDELAEQVDRLESELARLEEELGAATDAERRLTAREALDGTDVFVRYHSKGDATLKKAHDGSVRREDVTDNLRLEKHTQFDAGNVAVGGKNYPEFIEARPEYQFVRWTVEELLFEIRDTGHAQALKVLYDALPQVDRGELNGVVDVTFTEDGQETRTQESFDVILRDRMGNPLLVANLNDSREGATESMMSNLITAAERVGQTTETMAGAFLVTRSFFEPDALETAEEATRSGILSRDKRRSFVNISRKRGFHLCLVEARNQNFHLAVPEL